MTFDPYQNDPPNDPYRAYRDEDRSAGGAAILFGALLLAALGGFVWFYSSTDQTTATTEMRPPITQPKTGAAPAPETTGSSSNMPANPSPKAE
jgi:hypothetical protein